jgi:hypothetical protein
MEQESNDPRKGYRKMSKLNVKNNWGSLEFSWGGFVLDNIHAVLIRWPDGKESWHQCAQFRKAFHTSEQGGSTSGVTKSYYVLVEHNGLELREDIEGFQNHIIDVEVTVAARVVEVPAERKRMANLEASAKDLMGGNRRSAEFDGSIGGDGRTSANSGMGGPDAASWA